MIDQRSKFARYGISTEFVGEAQTEKSVVKRVLNGDVQLVYVTPENIVENPIYRNMLASKAYVKKLVALIVDEAHCIKMWGDQFRRAFSLIGDLRSLLPSDTKVMALTATATKETYDCAVKYLSMKEPVLVALSPDRGNIKYTVNDKFNVDQLSDLLYHEMISTHTFPKTVVFVRKYTDCSELYSILEHKLGSEVTSPPGYPNISEYRRIEMYSRVQTVEKKEKVLETFCSTIELLIATSAFGLGVDCPNIRRIIHWGVPCTVEEYVQEAGRAGRDGLSAVAILHRGKLGKHCSKGMKEYLSNNEHCRRRMLLNTFLCYFEKDISVSGCSCCDVCCRSCSCDKCKLS